MSEFGRRDGPPPPEPPVEQDPIGPPEPPPRSPPSAVAGLFGALLIAVGLLIATLSGLCSLGFLGVIVAGMFSANGGGAAAASMAVPLVFGGVPFGIGVLLIIAGRSLMRKG